MKKIVKSCEEDTDASSSLSSLPDEIILQILNKLIDLKTLCFCYLVSRRFSSIVLQVDAISFSSPLINPRILDKNDVGDVAPSRPRPLSLFMGESFKCAIAFLKKFKGVKSLFLELPSCSEIGIDNHCLFKWKVKFGAKIESFVFLSPNSISDKDAGNGDEEKNNRESNDMFTQISQIALKCKDDVMDWHILLLELVKNLPMLEKVSITDTGRRGRLSLSGEKLSEVKEWVHSAASKTVMGRVGFPFVGINGCIPVLKLPVSGYVMKGIYFGVMSIKDLQCGYDGLMKSEEDGFEDKEEAAYAEAAMAIFEKIMMMPI